MKTKKYKPYIRRANGREFGSGFREAMRLAVYERLGRPYYVLVQHGASNRVLAIGRTKRELRQCMCISSMRPNGSAFRKWANRVQQTALWAKRV